MNLLTSLSSWQLPAIPNEFKVDRIATLEQASGTIRSTVNQKRDIWSNSKIQLLAAEWLCEFVRQNVKRGRAFQLIDIVATRRADCLGYSKLLSTLGAT